jgi:hypothetical protein
MLLMLAEQEGRWADALLLRSHLARVAALAAPPASAPPASAAPHSAPRDASAQASLGFSGGLQNCLARLGCTELAQGLAHGNVAGVPRAWSSPEVVDSEAQSAASTLAQWSSIQVRA